MRVRMLRSSPCSDSILKNYEEMESQKTKLLVATEGELIFVNSKLI